MSRELGVEAVRDALEAVEVTKAEVEAANVKFGQSDAPLTDEEDAELSAVYARRWKAIEALRKIESQLPHAYLALHARATAAEARAEAAEKAAEQWKARMNHACMRLVQQGQTFEEVGLNILAPIYRGAADVVSEEYKVAEAAALALAEGAGT